MLRIETERLFFREFTSDDFDLFIDLNSDPEVIKYTGDTKFESVDEAKKVLRFVIQQYKEYGYGRLAVFEKFTESFVGFCGLKYHPEEGETDIGYRLKRAFWNKGYATEASKAILARGFQIHQLNTIVAHAMTENTSSLKVLQKLGMRFCNEIEMNGVSAQLFSITKKEWENLH